MALALSATVVDVNNTKKEIVITAQASGNYTTGGDTVNLNVIANPKNINNAVIGYPAKIEDYEVEQSPAGYTGVLVPGATPATWKLKVLQGGAAVSNPGAEIPQAAYPAALLAVGALFYLRLKGPKLQL
jgi:hypothetical protein